MKKQNRQGRSVLVATVVFGCTTSMFAQSTHSQSPASPGLGRYANISSQICGRKMVDMHPVRIPYIGCFSINSGDVLSGGIDGRTVTIRVTPSGEETFAVDGTEVHRLSSSSTNNPFVRPSTSGFAFCKKESPQECPVVIDVLDRKEGQLSVFDVSRMFKSGSYITNEENWVAERGR